MDHDISLLELPQPMVKKGQLRCPVDTCRGHMAPEFGAQELHTQLRYFKVLLYASTSLMLRYIIPIPI